MRLMRAMFLVVMAIGAVAADAAIVKVAAAAQATALDDTSGNKCAGGGGMLECVFVNGGAIWYTKTADGVKWTPPLKIDDGASPAIASSANGAGLLYVTPANSIAYRYRAGGAGWSAPSIVSQGFAMSPTLTAYGPRLFAAWIAGAQVWFAEIAENQLASAKSVEVVKALIPGKAEVSIAKTAIVALAPPKPGQPPLVRVFWFEMNKSVAPAGFFGVAYADRVLPPSNTGWPSKSIQNLAVFGANASAANNGISLSADAIASTGDVFVAASAITLIGPPKQLTQLYHQNVRSATPWAMHTISAKTSLIDVAARVEGAVCPKVRVRIAVAENPGGVGASWTRMATWGAVPEWSAMGTLSAGGRSPQALFWDDGTTPIGGRQFPRAVDVLFAEASGIFAVTGPWAGPSDCIPKPEAP